MLGLILFIVYLIMALICFTFTDVLHIIFGLLWAVGGVLNLIAGILTIKNNIENKEARERWQRQEK